MSRPLHIFIPPSWRAGHARQAIEAAAAARGLSAQFIGDRATDAHVAAPASAVNLYQQLDYVNLTPLAGDWIIVPPPGSEDCVRLFQTLHPEMGRAWAVTHGSEGLAASLWLAEHGADIVTEERLLIGGHPVGFDVIQDQDRAGAPELTAFSDLNILEGETSSFTQSLLASSPGFLTDAEGWHDLSGRARHLLSGPHIFLPAGMWRVDLEFDVDVQEGAPRLSVQWGGGALQRTQFTTIVRASGAYIASLESHFDRPDAAHCLVATDAAQLQGRFRFKECRLTRVAPVHGSDAYTTLNNWA